MRRKAKAAETTATPEKRRSTRGRGRKSPTPEEQPEQQQESESQAEAVVEEEPKRRSRRTRTPSIDVSVKIETPKRGRGRKKVEEVIVEETVEPIAEEESTKPEEVTVIEENTNEDNGPETETAVEQQIEPEPEQIEVPETVDVTEESQPVPEMPEVAETSPPEPETVETTPVVVEEEEEETTSEKPISPRTDDEPAMELHADDEISHQGIETTPEETSHDEIPQKAAGSEAEEGEVIDDSNSEDKPYEEESRPQRPTRKMRLNNDRRVSNEQKKSADATTRSVDSKKSESDADAATAITTAVTTSTTTTSNEIAADKENAPRTRKRRWITQKSTETKQAIISISTDSLKNIIKDVQPVPLADVKLDLTPERSSEKDEKSVSPEPEPQERKRKVSLAPSADDDEMKDRDAVKDKKSVEDKQEKPVPKPFAPPKHKPSTILYITNLVRPFTVLQLRGLLARTGKIVENGFWIDKIKSKCYVKYENEDEAVETRHALHGVRWPESNPKCLHVDFGRDTDMEKAVMSTLEETVVTRTITNDVAIARGGETEAANSFGWSKADAYRNDVDDKAKQAARPVREWDLGKQRTEDKEKDRDRRRDRERERSRDRVRDRGSDRRDRRRTPEKRSRSLSTDRNQRNKKEEPPLRLLDDLFRKTKTTPCIYWLPLTADLIQEKEEVRKKRLQEQQQRQEAQRKAREEEIKKRQRERERRRSASREREREKRRRSRSRSRSRSPRRRYR